MARAFIPISGLLQWIQFNKTLFIQAQSCTYVHFNLEFLQHMHSLCIFGFTIYYFFPFNLMVLFSFTSLQEGSTSSTTLLYVVFLCSMTLGTILMCFLTKKTDEGESRQPDSSVSFYSNVVSLSKSVINPLFDLRMLLVIPLIAYSGLQQAFVW